MATRLTMSPAEAVGLPVGQADDRDPLLGQQRLGHRGVGTCHSNV